MAATQMQVFPEALWTRDLIPVHHVSIGLGLIYLGHHKVLTNDDSSGLLLTDCFFVTAYA